LHLYAHWEADERWRTPGPYAAPAANFAAAIVMAPIAARTTNLEVEFSAIVVLWPI